MTTTLGFFTASASATLPIAKDRSIAGRQRCCEYMTLLQTVPQGHDSRLPTSIRQNENVAGSVSDGELGSTVAYASGSVFISRLFHFPAKVFAFFTISMNSARWLPGSCDLADSASSRTSG